MLVSRWFKLLSSRPKTALVHGVSCTSTLPSCRPYHSTSHLLRHEKQRPSIKSLYIDTAAPTTAQSAASKLFFRTHLPSKSWTATEWRTTDINTPTLTPEVAFLGRSNSGKSSLLNAVLLDPVLCRVGPKPGKTTTMHAWSLAPIDEKTRGARRGYQGDTEPKLTILDMPGYGHGSHGDWGNDIMKYLTTRRQFRRAFVLINPMHGLKSADLHMLELLRKHGVPHQLVACKCDHDSIKDLPNLLEGIQSTIKTHFATRGKTLPVLMTINDILAIGGLGDGRANQRVEEEAMYGVDDVRWAVIRAVGLEEYVLALRANGELLPKKKSGGRSQSISAQEEKIIPESNLVHEDNSTLHTISDNDVMQSETEPGATTVYDESALGSSSNPLADLSELTAAKKSESTSESAPFPPDIGMSVEDFLGDLAPARTQPSISTPALKPSLSTPSIGIGIDELMSMTASPKRQKNPNTDSTTNLDRSRHGMRQRSQDTKGRKGEVGKNPPWNLDRISKKSRLNRR